MLLCAAGTAIARGQVYSGTGSTAASTGGLVGGAEMLFLKAYSNTYDQVATWISHGGNAPSNSFELSPRIWLGYVGESGFGIRGRWFQYQHTLNAGTGTADEEDSDGLNLIGEIGGLYFGLEREDYELTTRNQLDVYAVDVDFMQRIDFEYWQANLGAGLRTGGVKRRTSVEWVPLIEGEEREAGLLATTFEGVGPTIFAELKRPIGAGGLSLIANARGSLLFGDRRVYLQYDGEEEFGDHVLASEGLVAVGEIQFGVEYARRLGYGTIGFAQCLWEGQIWSDATHVAVLSDDLGLMGLALNFGIAR